MKDIVDCSKEFLSDDKEVLEDSESNKKEFAM
jgi:hypothetical protein